MGALGHLRGASFVKDGTSLETINFNKVLTERLRT
ncbi:hypothetical protein HDE76_004165 [Rhodanobacter sp. ANJX3]|nr:hypothetical protein [Rhodanobacter sp. ANJX3]NYE28920.1 hypothetical protein [Rhodanobacter sp. K2T2]